MKLLILIIFFLSFNSGFSKSGFIAPYKIGNYYEFEYTEPLTVIRYSAKIVSDTLMNNKTYLKMDIYNEPPMVLHSLFFYFDSTSLNLYGGENPRCPDSSGDMLAAGFNLPVGYFYNDCPLGAYFKSEIVANGITSGVLNTTDSLRFVIRQDTVGVPIEGTTLYSFVEKFGYVFFYRGYGSPLKGGPYSKKMVGAIIDGIIYGSILLDVNQISNEIPSGYKLSQNFPNPFNPSTVIRFSLRNSSFVSLKIYDQLGKEISTLVNEKKGAGEYQYVFNAMNISSGIYYYTLTANDFIETKKMMVMK